MRKFTESENIAISGILKIEGLSLAFGRVLKPIIDDIDLKKLVEADILEHEERIAAIKKIIEDWGKDGAEI